MKYNGKTKIKTVTLLAPSICVVENVDSQTEIFRSPSNLISYQISCYQNQPPICLPNAKKGFFCFLKTHFKQQF